MHYQDIFCLVRCSNQHISIVHATLFLHLAPDNKPSYKAAVSAGEILLLNNLTSCLLRILFMSPPLTPLSNGRGLRPQCHVPKAHYIITLPF